MSRVGITTKEIGIIVLAWNESQKTIALLKRLAELDRSGCVTHVILVDNGSDQLTSQRLLRAVQSLANDVAYVKSPRNLGFGAGMNLGIDHLSRDKNIDYYWLLNNDTLPSEDCIQRVAQYIDRHPEKKIIGTTLIDSGSNRIQCAGGCQYNSWLAIDHPYLRDQDISLIDSSSQNSPGLEFDYVYGASFFVRAEFFLQVGGFSDRFFLYFEELELGSHCARSELGWCRQAYVNHDGGATQNSDPATVAFCAYHAALSSFRFTRTHFPLKLPTVILARFLGKTYHAMQRRNLALIRAAGLAFVDFLSGHTRTEIEAVMGRHAAKK